jgi:hypothetical protein
MSAGQGEDDSGLFGQLPRSRPGSRSPRRAASAESQVPAAEEPTAEPPRPEPEPPPPPTTEESPAPGARFEEGGAGLEELAWAGIAVTAEAATLGVRLFSRAIDAARKATERR